MDTNRIIHRILATSEPLLAPNGKKSNLNPLQWKMVRTSEFKKWFGDWEKNPKSASKIVDENGEPLVVFHGTTADFSSFDPSKIGSSTDTGMWGSGFYFTYDKSYAGSYAGRKQGKGAMMPVFLSIKNPLVIDSKSDIPKIEVPKTTVQEMRDADKNYSIAFRDFVLSAKKDGVMGDYADEYVVYFPNQIKSAIGNKGTFNPRSNDITAGFNHEFNK